MSTDDRFKNFVQQQQRVASQEREIDWGKQRDEWLGYLGQLYNQIEDFLSDYVQSGAVELHQSPIRLHEEHIGSYQANVLTITIGAQKIRFEPIGTLLIGSKGRVDVNGSAGNSRLMLINKVMSSPSQMIKITVRRGDELNRPPPPPPPPETIEWAWKIVSKPPTMRFIELNKDSFLQMILEVSNG